MRIAPPAVNHRSVAAT